jgi:hypothetical protein
MRVVSYALKHGVKEAV